MDKPVIGIIPLVDIERKSYWMLPGYMDGIQSQGGIPVMLPLTEDRDALRQIADQFDGFLFTGGHDISPDMYGEQRLPSCGECCKGRDEMERILFSFIWERNKPALGICRGIQFINVALGGTLYQDLPTQAVSDLGHCQTSPYDKPAHTVQVVKDAPLYALLQEQEISVNSYHHQGIKQLAAALHTMAHSPDGIIEAVYAPGKKYIWGVQWHPEFTVSKDENSQKIFQSFIHAAQ